MISEFERNFFNNYNGICDEIDGLISVRKNREDLFNEQYFTNRFWDIILLLYKHDIDQQPVNADIIAKDLGIARNSILRYLTVLLADKIICSYDNRASLSFDITSDSLSLTRLGFKNAESIIQQTRTVFATFAKSSVEIEKPRSRFRA